MNGKGPCEGWSFWKQTPYNAVFPPSTKSLMAHYRDLSNGAALVTCTVKGTGARRPEPSLYVQVLQCKMTQRGYLPMQKDLKDPNYKYLQYFIPSHESDLHICPSAHLNTMSQSGWALYPWQWGWKGTKTATADERHKSQRYNTWYFGGELICGWRSKPLSCAGSDGEGVRGPRIQSKEQKMGFIPQFWNSSTLIG